MADCSSTPGAGVVTGEILARGCMWIYKQRTCVASATGLSIVNTETSPSATVRLRLHSRPRSGAPTTISCPSRAGLAVCRLRKGLNHLDLSGHKLDFVDLRIIFYFLVHI